MYAVVRTTGRLPVVRTLTSDVLDLLLDPGVEPVPGLLDIRVDGAESDIHQDHVEVEEHERSDEHQNERRLPLLQGEGEEPGEDCQSETGASDSVEPVRVRLFGSAGDAFHHLLLCSQQANQRSE